MHEMGIAASVLEAIEKEMKSYPGHRVAKVGLRIGQFAGVDAESVRFCFDVMVRHAGCGPLELAIETACGDELGFVYIELDEVEVTV
jgi:hydrogenase nickel incorporation protein HypA/HybF